MDVQAPVLSRARGGRQDLQAFQGRPWEPADPMRSLSRPSPASNVSKSRDLPAPPSFHAARPADRFSGLATGQACCQCNKGVVIGSCVAGGAILAAIIILSVLLS